MAVCRFIVFGIDADYEKQLYLSKCSHPTLFMFGIKVEWTLDLTCFPYCYHNFLRAQLSCQLVSPVTAVASLVINYLLLHPKGMESLLKFDWLSFAISCTVECSKSTMLGAQSPYDATTKSA